MALSITHATTADGSFSAQGEAAWSQAHAITGGSTEQIVYGSTSGSLAQSIDLTFKSTRKEVVLGSSLAFGLGTGAFPTVDGPGLYYPNNADTGGQLWMSAQNVSSSSTAFGSGGTVDIRAGSVSSTAVGGVGGTVTILAGNAAGPIAAGGSINLKAGNVSGTGAAGAGGNVEVAAGDSADAPGATVTVRAKSGVGTDQNGGDVILKMGAATGTGRQGYLNFGRDGGFSYGVANGTDAVTITSVRPAVVTNATIQKWLPVVVDGLIYHMPLWR